MDLSEFNSIKPLLSYVMLFVIIGIIIAIIMYCYRDKSSKNSNHNIFLITPRGTLNVNSRFAQYYFAGIADACITSGGLSQDPIEIKQITDIIDQWYPNLMKSVVIPPKTADTTVEVGADTSNEIAPLSELNEILYNKLQIVINEIKSNNADYIVFDLRDLPSWSWP